MTHTNHRQGTPESLADSFVVLAIAAQGINREGAAEKLQRYLRLAAQHNPVNAGNINVGNILELGGMDGLCAAMKGGHIAQVAFDSEDNLAGFLGDLNRAELGLSVVVTGLFDHTRECCRQAGLHRHTVEYSLGVFGRTDLLAEPSIMEVTTMCGHGQISFNLVRRAVKDVSRGVLTLEEGTELLTRPCVCGIFDPTRARRLLAKLVAEELRPALRNYVAMDPSKCDRCYACEVACAEAHPDNHGQGMCIVDASLGPAVSLHCLHCVDAPCQKACATGNIVRDAERDVVYMRGDRCIGCKLCVSACPFGMILWDQGRGRARKCDLCLERLEKGETPACVAGCPTGALSSADTGDQQRRRRLLALQTTLAAIPLVEGASVR